MPKIKEGKIEIIAELAQGFEGNHKLAQLLTLGALKTDADAIKFQLVYADELATPDYHYYKLFKSLEMPLEIWRDLVTMIHTAGKKVYFDIFGEESLRVAAMLEADGIKLSTTEFYNSSLVGKALKGNFAKIFISIGGIPIEDVHALIHRESLRPEKICFMFGFQAEPTPLESNNLRRVTALSAEFPGFDLGFMDHSLGKSDDAFYLPVMALATGITCIEKHLTLDPLLEVEDFISALTPSRFKHFVSLVRRYETALGKTSLELTDLEHEYRNKATKVVVALHDLPKGTKLSTENAALKRVGEMFRSSRTIRTMETVLGKELLSALKKHEPVVEELI